MVQAIISTGTQDEWLESDLGLGPIDTAMSVALPEFDGRLISVPISFKEEVSAGPEPAGRAGESERATGGLTGTFCSATSRAMIAWNWCRDWPSSRPTWP